MCKGLGISRFSPPLRLNSESNSVRLLPVMGGITHKMALGGNRHFFVLINGMSFV